MDKRVVVASIVAVFFWGVAAVVDKLAFNSMPEMSPVTAQWIRFMVATMSLAVIGAFRNTFTEIRTVSAKAYMYLIIGALGGLALGSAAYFYALKHGEASTVVVFTSGYPVIMVFLAVPFLKEKMSWQKLGGMALVVAGLLIVSNGGG